MDNTQDLYDTIDIEFMCHLVKKNMGLNLAPEDHFLLFSRLAPVIQKHSLKGFSGLVSKLRLFPDESLVEDVLEVMMIHETSFFRGKRIFESLKNYLITEYQKNPDVMRKISIWSAATSSGQEAYSLAMLLEESQHLLKGCAVDILATDLSGKIIQVARDGIFSSYEVSRSVPPHFISKYFTNIGHDCFQVNQSIRDKITFRTHNLLHSSTESKKFKMILCRSALIYFDQEMKQKIIKNLSDKLEPSGILVLGGTEILQGMDNSFSSIEDVEGAYSKKSSFH